MGKKTHPLTLIDTAERFQGPNSGCQHSEAVDGDAVIAAVKPQVTSAGAEF